jgi:hypothetical protein
MCGETGAGSLVGMTTNLTQARRPWRLRGRARKGMLIAHLLSAGIWIGVDLLVAVFVLVGWFSDDAGLRSVAYQALGSFVLWPMLVSALVCLATGVVLGLGSKYGLVRYWWVAVKLVLNLVLAVLIIVLLRPGMDEVVAYGRSVGAGEPTAFDASGLFFPPAVSLSALTFATILSVAKPWGRLRKT